MSNNLVSRRQGTLNAPHPLAPSAIQFSVLQSFACRFRDGPFDAYETSGGSMSKVRVHNFAISLDGYGAGPRQGLEHPLGVGGEELHGWYLGTRAFREMHGQTGGTTGPDNDFAKRFGERIGAYIMGRNMFGPVRGPWPDDRWRGWWGENPPYHVPGFVLTNHAREAITMEDGPAFHRDRFARVVRQHE